MAEPVSDALVKSVAQQFGQAVLGRAATADEAEALTIVLKAAADALREGQGFIQRLARQVREERETENVEEFFGDIITPD